MFYDIYIKRGAHWRAYDKKPGHNTKMALRKFESIKKDGVPVVLVVSNSDPRYKDAGLRFVAGLMKQKHDGTGKTKRAR